MMPARPSARRYPGATRPGHPRLMARPAGSARHLGHPLPAAGPGRPRWRLPAIVTVVALLGVITIWTLPALSAFPSAAEPSSSPPAQSRSVATDEPSNGRRTLPTAAAATASPEPEPPSPAATDGPVGTGPASSPSGRPTSSGPSTSPATGPRAAPRSAAEFDQQRQVIEIGFPLRAATRYRYRDNWRDLRAGEAQPYNHAHSRRDGKLRRAHDGIDIYAAHGEPVLSPFDGIIIDPGTRWRPWIPERYGVVAAVRSEEPTSEGYLAVLSHLDRLWVEPGQRVRRGEVLGSLGTTGNAEGGRAHLHFELRAPFELTWREVGEDRPVDAFNPYPSLVAADPKR